MTFQPCIPRALEQPTVRKVETELRAKSTASLEALGALILELRARGLDGDADLLTRIRDTVFRSMGRIILEAER